jgi:hypothetical protein
MASWNHIQTITPKKYTCFFCDSLVASDKGYYSGGGQIIYICPNCTNPTYFLRDQLRQNQYPSPAFGNRVDSVPKEVADLYAEVRACTTANAFTAAVLACRKILMHIAVEKGDSAGKTFLEYIEYLSSKGFVPPNGEEWVDHIRQKGNEANHEIVLMSSEDAKDLITFIEMLLKFIYEFPNKIKKQPQ